MPYKRMQTDTAPATHALRYLCEALGLSRASNMIEEEILENVKILWNYVQMDRDFSEEISHEINRLLNKEILGLEDFKELGTEMYREVGRSNYLHGDIKRDGIRSISHFVMGLWEIKSGRLNESERRLQIAKNGMKNYIENHVKKSAY